jgi:hypothetical protein
MAMNVTTDSKISVMIKATPFWEFGVRSSEFGLPIPHAGGEWREEREHPLPRRSEAKAGTFNIQHSTFNSDKLRFREHATKSVPRTGIEHRTPNEWVAVGIPHSTLGVEC